jgi:hypothetical protein
VIGRRQPIEQFADRIQPRRRIHKANGYRFGVTNPPKALLSPF